MILKAGKTSYELPPFDRLDFVVLRSARDYANYPLEVTTVDQIKRFQQLQDQTLGKIRGKPTQVAIEDGHTIHFNQRPDKAYIVDVYVWHRGVL